MKLIDKDVILKYENRYIELPEELKNDIKVFWKNATKENPNLFDGENFIIESMNENENKIEFLTVKSHYSHYLYNERIGIQEEKYRACSPWTGLEYPNIKRNVYGFIALGKIEKTKEELIIHFNEYKNYLLENNLETEFEKLIFFKKENAVYELDQLPNPKRPYLRELLKVAMQ